MRLVLTYLRRYWKAALIAPLLMVLEVAMDLLQPRMMQRIVDEGIRTGNQAIILETGALMLVFALIGAVGGIGCTVFAVRAAFHTGADLRESAYEKIQTLSFGNLDSIGTGQLVTRLTSDVTQIQDVILIALRILVRVPLLGIGSFIMALLTNPQLALIALPLLPPMMFLLWFIIQRAHPLYMRVQTNLDRLNTVIQENLSGMRVIKAFVRDQHENQRFENANQTLTQTSLTAMQLTSITQPFSILLLNISIAGLIWFGGLAVNNNIATVGQIIALITYLTQMLSTLISVSMLLMRLSRARASIDRLGEVFEAVPEVQDRPNALSEFQAKGRVVFENVSFGYGEPVLQNISFTAEPGQTIAILGATGSGKSSLVQLIPRFYDVTEGKVMIDGVDVRDIQQSALRANIGISLQEAVLFSGTIAENLRQGNPDASEEALQLAARVAQAETFVSEMPEGYDTQLGQRGVNLSGGQKQRLAIARAVLRAPTILILDDSTSAVDVTTESRLQKELAQIMQNRTSFVVAQRISTVLTADKILVLENGKLAAEGTHTELIKTSPIYRQIYESQLGAFDK